MSLGAGRHRVDSVGVRCRPLAVELAYAVPLVLLVQGGMYLLALPRDARRNYVLAE